jgi:hypothetical protein
MAYEEPIYKIVRQDPRFEIRYYDNRLIIQVAYQNVSRGFQKLFQYISGNNQKAQKIPMTVPVTQYAEQQGRIMQFYLPSQLNTESTPLPLDGTVEVTTIKAGHFAVIQYSGFASDRNFEKKSEILKLKLIQNNIQILSPAIKATYNGPFTPPWLRRNEAMFRVKWD